jgi:hypothetical protein
LKDKTKEYKYEISMQRIGDLVIYNSPSLNFKRKINSSNLIYPFLFEKINENQVNSKIYYPEIDSLVNRDDLMIKENLNGYYAPPFNYEKIEKMPSKIEYLDIMKFREVKSTKIKEEYPIKYIISFDSNITPTSDLRQKCYENKNNIICELTNNNKISIKNLAINKNKINLVVNNSKILQSFIKEYKLNTYKLKDDLITKLIDALHREIKYKDISKKLNTEEILKMKYGDCTEFSQVAVDVLKSLKIDSKRIYGLIYKPKKGKWLYHSWVEYEDDGVLYGFDPVNKRSPINLNYLKLGEENKYGIIIIPLDIDNIIFKNVF